MFVLQHKFKKFNLLCYNLDIVTIGRFIMDLFNTKEIRSREKLFNSLVKNADTTYIMCDKKKRTVLYMTKNLSEVMHMDDLENTSTNFERENSFLEWGK